MVHIYNVENIIQYNSIQCCDELHLQQQTKHRVMSIIETIKNIMFYKKIIDFTLRKKNLIKCYKYFILIAKRHTSK